MENTVTQFICVQPNYPGECWWRYDTLSFNMKDSKRLLLGGGEMTWKQCYKIGWRCLKVQMTLKTLKP